MLLVASDKITFNVMVDIERFNRSQFPVQHSSEQVLLPFHRYSIRVERMLLSHVLLFSVDAAKIRKFIDTFCQTIICKLTTDSVSAAMKC